MAISIQASTEEGSTTIRMEYLASAGEAPDTSNGDDIVSSLISKDRAAERRV
jgi:hypothetical protein